mgnify:CR=1 FL=1
MRSLRKYVRNIIKEFAIPTYEEEMLPIPGMAYPIEIEDIVVDDVADLILAPEGEQDMVMMDIMDPEGALDIAMIEEPLPMMDVITVDELEPAVSIDIAHDAVDPILDTIEDVFVDEDMEMYPYEHHDDDGRMFDYGHTKSDSHEGRMTRAKLYRMGKMAQSFHDRLEDGDDLPQWVNDKVTTAEDRLRSAFEYIDYKIHRLEKSGCGCNEATVRRMVRNYLRG